MPVCGYHHYPEIKEYAATARTVNARMTFDKESLNLYQLRSGGRKLCIVYAERLGLPRQMLQRLSGGLWKQLTLVTVTKTAPPRPAARLKSSNKKS